MDATVDTTFLKQGRLGQKNVGQKDSGYVFAQNFSAHHAGLR
jgi:hypothetical protein